jgi:hypothetical protein
MFRPKTLFVVGAGASCEAKLPSGNQLKAQIANMLDLAFDEDGDLTSGDRQIDHSLERVAAQSGDPHAFAGFLNRARAIRDGMPLALSIDNYLDAHREDDQLEFVGKLAIAKCILDAERGSLLGRDGGGYPAFQMDRLTDSWFVRFSQLLTENVARQDVPAALARVKIITFNYDRTIVHFLRQALTTYYQVPARQAEEWLSELKIYHPYGNVGALDWEASAGRVAFGETDAVNLVDVARQIRTFTERIEEGEPLQAIRNAVDEADRIVFLGFGFHRQNLKLLTPAEPISRTRATVYGTVMGISGGDQEDIRSDLNRVLRRVLPNSGHVWEAHIHFFNGDCAHLLDEYRRSLTEG